MKILYIYQYFGTPKGGWSTRVYEMCKRWVQMGYQVTVLTTPYDKSDLQASRFIEWQRIEGIDVLIINIRQSNKYSFFKRLTGFFIFSVIATFYALRLKYDAIIASSGPITVGIPALTAHLFRSIPLIFEVRDLWPRGAIELGVIRNSLVKKITYAFEARCYRSSALIVACSQGMADDIKSRFPHSKIIVVPNACDHVLFENQKNNFETPSFLNDRHIIIYAGSMGVMDNCGQIIEGVKKLKNLNFKNVVIVMIGEGAERSMLENEAKENQLDQVVFLGLIPKEEVVGWLQIALASLVVFKNVPVLNTSSPNKLFDSLAAGVPVIQTTEGWIKELVDQRKIGTNVPPDNPDALAKAIIEMCENEGQRKQYASNAKIAAHELFDRDKLSRVMIESISHAIKT